MQKAKTKRRLGATLIATFVVGLVAVVSFQVLSSSPSTQAAADVVVVSPEPGSITATPTTQISFLGVPADDLGTITVTGSVSGVHQGSLHAYSTGNGASFVPDSPFVVGERVTVTTDLDLAQAPSGTFSFVIGDVLANGPANPHSLSSTTAAGVEHFVSAPTLAPPSVTVDTDTGSVDGDFFLAPKGPVGQAGLMILNSAGKLVWFDPLLNETAFDFNEQSFHGHEDLTWFQGEVVRGHGEGVDIIANRSYQTVATVHAGNGLMADLHEFQLSNSGTALITAYEPLRYNLTSVGGSPDGTLFTCVIQEIDVATGLVMYQWNSLDHIPVTRSNFKAAKNPNVGFDYFHLNSIQQIGNGQLLISSRNTSAIYDISESTGGNVLWQIGGKSSTFKLGAGATFHFQHDAREINSDTISVFDDEASPAVGPQSRALLLHLDMASKTVTLERAYVHDPSELGIALGNVEVMASGDIVVDWGTTPYFSEYAPSGAVLFDAKLPHNDDTYRAYLHPWAAVPTTKPSLVARPKGNGTVALYMSWNGATGVARWRVLAGSTSVQLRSVRVLRDERFEMSTRVRTSDSYFKVEALATNGRVLSSSPVVHD